MEIIISWSCFTFNANYLIFYTS